MTFEEWWNENYADNLVSCPDGADRTFGEEVWNAARETMDGDDKEHEE